MTLPLVILAVLAISVAWDFTLIGYGLVAAAFVIFRGVQQGWFQRPAHGHAHAAHGHDDHGHAHGHGHEDHAHAAHSPAAHADHHAEPAAPPFTWSYLGLTLLGTLLLGGVIQLAIQNQVPKDSLPRRLALVNLLEQARPAGTLADAHGRWLAWTWPDEHKSHAASIRIPVTLLATGTWVGGILLAATFFWWGYLSPADVRRQFAPLHNLLWNKYYFDELYDAIFVQPTHVISRLAAGIDKRWIDGLIDFSARAAVRFSNAWDVIADRGLVDGLANLTASWTYSLGNSLRAVQTGNVRQYVMFIVVGAVAIFVLISFFWSPTLPASTLGR
jgi:NADH-quinone oxidoreductase subunit L